MRYFDPFVLFEDPLNVAQRISVMKRKNTVIVRNGTIYYWNDKVGRIVTGDPFPENTYQLDNGTYSRYRSHVIREIKDELKRKGYRPVFDDDQTFIEKRYRSPQQWDFKGGR